MLLVQRTRATNAETDVLVTRPVGRGGAARTAGLADSATGSGSYVLGPVGRGQWPLPPQELVRCPCCLPAPCVAFHFHRPPVGLRRLQVGGHSQICQRRPRPAGAQLQPMHAFSSWSSLAIVRSRNHRTFPHGEVSCPCKLSPAHSPTLWPGTVRGARLVIQ